MTALLDSELLINQHFVDVYNYVKTKKRKLSKAEFCESIGLKREYFSRIEANKMSVPEETITKISNIYQISEKWFRTGEGNVTQIKFDTSNANQNIESVTVTTKADFVELPYIEHLARASFMEMMNDDPYEHLKTTFFYTEAPEAHQKGAVVLEVNGDSMEPQLRHGSKVLAIPVPKGDWCYASGKIYGVIYNNYFVIKRITHNNQKDKTITLSSDNIQGGVITIPINEVRFMWRIIEVHSKVE